MDYKANSLRLDSPCDEAVDRLILVFEQAGLQVMRTFDLHSTRLAQVNCPCPHHGTEQCDCQMVVLLVYSNDPNPISVVAHGYNQQTWVSVVDTPQQRAGPKLEVAVRYLLASQISINYR